MERVRIDLHLTAVDARYCPVSRCQIPSTDAGGQAVRRAVGERYRLVEFIEARAWMLAVRHRRRASRFSFGMFGWPPGGGLRLHYIDVGADRTIARDPRQNLPISLRLEQED